MSQIQEQELLELDEILDDIYVIIIHNDDYNTFDHVIECLVKYCGHDTVQAEQCAYLIHFKGKSDVKRGAKSEMKKIYKKLKSCSLTVTMEVA